MGSFVCRQPNGLLCRFSTITDCITHYNMTDEEYIQMKMEEARKDAQDVIDNYLQPFKLIDDYFIPNNMTKEDFEQLKIKMEEPQVIKKNKCDDCHPSCEELTINCGECKKSPYNINETGECYLCSQGYENFFESIGDNNNESR